MSLLNEVVAFLNPVIRAIIGAVESCCEFCGCSNYKELVIAILLALFIRAMFIGVCRTLCLLVLKAQEACKKELKRNSSKARAAAQDEELIPNP